jgi:23S rRNA G2069 N7-methylase RlmK/C1962 C5-methylase RlmI
MTKKLEALFDLPEQTEEKTTPEQQIEQAATIDRANTNLEKIEAALPQVNGLAMGDTELDELSDLAVESFKDLSSLGLQVDARHAGEILGVASTMLGHAINAKTNKLNKKLKMIELQLRKAALDQKTAEKAEELDAIPIGEGRALDRNELLRILAAKSTDK